MRQLSPLHNLPFYLFKMDFRLPYHIRLGLPSGLSSSLLSTSACIQVLTLLSIRATRSSHLIPPTYQYPVKLEIFITTKNTNQ